MILLVSVLLSALVERCFVSRIKDFGKQADSPKHSVLANQPPGLLGEFTGGGSQALAVCDKWQVTQDIRLSKCCHNVDVANRTTGLKYLTLWPILNAVVKWSPIQKCYSFMKKSYLWETKHLSTDVDCSTNTKTRPGDLVMPDPIG